MLVVVEQGAHLSSTQFIWVFNRSYHNFFLRKLFFASYQSNVIVCGYVFVATRASVHNTETKTEEEMALKRLQTVALVGVSWVASTVTPGTGESNQQRAEERNWLSSAASEGEESNREKMCVHVGPEDPRGRVLRSMNPIQHRASEWHSLLYAREFMMWLSVWSRDSSDTSHYYHEALHHRIKVVLPTRAIPIGTRVTDSTSTLDITSFSFSPSWLQPKSATFSTWV